MADQERKLAVAIPDAETCDVKPARSVHPGHHDPVQIGLYRILERIGEGGMGVVYKAEQREPVRRIVALKVIKLGMDTKEMIARFEAERQALALMSHPNVAKVYEAGMMDSGRPFFAMEHVPGVPLTRYCDDAKLNTRERLELFIPVCHAIQHAHQKGIIHRDLKPTNILVQLFDGKAVPKVIDFGIAKATSSALTQHTLFTQAGTLVGTPEYMSPEQAMTSGLDVDTRTDIYSLGAILYELLTGSLPLDARTLRQGGPEAMAQMIKESEPRKPSTRVSDTHGEGGKSDASGTFAEIAKRHRTDPRTLRREISGDLDWIVLRAMEKERTRRYETANGLAMDILRHLNDEPVLARPPSARYRMSKLMRKHRGGVMAAGFVLLALLLGVVATSVALVMARQSEAAAKISEAKAKDQAIKAQALSGFLEDLLSSAQPGAEGGRSAKIVDLLDRASAEMSNKLRDQPEAEISGRVTLGKTYYELLLYSAAAQNYRRAYELAKDTFGSEAERTLEIGADFSMAITQSGGDSLQAERLARQTLESARKSLGEHHRVTYRAESSLASALSSRAERAEAISILRQLIRDAREHPDVVPASELARYLNNFAATVNARTFIQNDLKLAAESEACLREALQIAVKGGKVSPTLLARVRSNLARMLNAQGKIPEATVMWRDALTEARSTMGESHQITRDLIANAADGFDSLQQYDEAISCRRELLTFALEAQPRNQEYIASIKYRLAWELIQNGNFGEALRLNAESVATRQKLFGVYDSPSRQPWYDALILELSVNEPWASQALRAETCQVYYQLLFGHPTWPMPADKLVPQRLRFKLLKWEGDAAGKEKALTKVAEGNWADLHRLPEPAAGVYLLWLEVPRADQSPLHHADWILIAPWQLSFHNINVSPEENPAEWEQTIQSKPVKQGVAGSLALDEFWHLYSEQPPRLTLFGTVATATMTVPAGGYQIITYADARQRIWMDKRQLNNWRHEDLLSVESDGLAHQCRLEHFHTWGNNYYLWMRMAPTGAVADAAYASVVDSGEGLKQALSKFGNDPPASRSADLLNRRWFAYARGGLFKQAADDLQVLCELQPEDHWHWYYRGCLLAYLGDVEAYRANCRAMLDKYGDTQQDFIADRTAKTCLLIPGAGGDVGQLNKMMDLAVEHPTNRNFLPWFRMGKGFAEFRAGDFEGALGRLTRCQAEAPGTGPLVTIESLLAMTHLRLGHSQEAREFLKRAKVRAETSLPKAGVDLLEPDNVENWLIAQVILREATELIEGKTANDR